MMPDHLREVFEGTGKKRLIVTLNDLQKAVEDFLKNQCKLPIALTVEVNTFDIPGHAFVFFMDKYPVGLVAGLLQVWGRWLLKLSKEIDEYYQKIESRNR